MSTNPGFSVSPHPWGKWRRGGLGLLAGLLLTATLAGWLGLDPWLRRTLEKQVAAKTGGQYQLSIGHLETRLFARALHLRHIALRPTPRPIADTLPRLRLHLARLDLSGVGLLALLRGQTVPLDSLVLDSLQLHVVALAKKPPPHPTPPLYQQRPVRLAYLAVHHAGGTLGPAAAPIVQVPRADVLAHDILFTSAGAADTQRLAFAAAWQAVLRYPQGRLGGHVLELATAAFSTTGQLLTLDSLRIEPPAPGQGQPGATQVALLLPQLRVRGLRAAYWQHQHRFRADSLVAQQPRLSFRPPAQAPPPLWQLLAPLARRTDLGHLLINDAFMAVTGLKHRPAVRHVFAVGSALRVDSVGGRASQGRVLYAKNWVAHSGRLTAVFSAPVYPASIEHAFLNTQAGTMRLTGLALWPLATPVQLNRRKGYQATQLRVRVAELRAQGFDFNLLSDHSHVRIAHLTAQSPWLGLSSDGRGPLDPHRSVLTPEAMRRLRLPLEIGRLDLRNGTIATRYRSPSSPRVGTLTINRLAASLHNVSNDPRRQALARPLTGTATAYLAGRARLRVRLTAPLLDPQGRHHIWGSIGPAPLSLLNSLTVPTKLLGFRRGQVQGITFDMQVNQRQVTGTMRATYSDLEFEFYRYKKGGLKKPLFTRLKTGLVNGLLIRHDNPRPGGRFVVGDMTSRRELRFSVFSAWRQGLVSGLLNSVGVPGKTAQRLSQSQTTGPLP